MALMIWRHLELCINMNNTRINQCTRTVQKEKTVKNGVQWILCGRCKILKKSQRTGFHIFYLKPLAEVRVIDSEEIHYPESNVSWSTCIKILRLEPARKEEVEPGISVLNPRPPKLVADWGHLLATERRASLSKMYIHNLDLKEYYWLRSRSRAHKQRSLSICEGNTPWRRAKN